jgi:hypothetical protein
MRNNIGSEALAEGVMKNAVLWDVTRCSPIDIIDVSEELTSCIIRRKLRQAASRTSFAWKTLFRYKPDRYTLEDGDSKFLRNVGELLSDYKMSRPRKYNYACP